jgi:hypothetical protein
MERLNLLLGDLTHPAAACHHGHNSSNGWRRGEIATVLRVRCR